MTDSPDVNVKITPYDRARINEIKYLKEQKHGQTFTFSDAMRDILDTVMPIYRNGRSCCCGAADTNGEVNE